MLVLSALTGILSVGIAGAAIAPLDSVTSVSFTVTTTSNYPATMGGALQVNFDSIQLTTPVPQAYAFGVRAKTSQGLWITQLVWQFGDGSMMNVPYCCQSDVSEVQYHSYTQQGSYTVMVVAYDNMGNFGNAIVTVNWTTPVPEFKTGTLTMFATLFIVLTVGAILKKRQIHLKR